jgi:hypothetical protein
MGLRNWLFQGRDRELAHATEKRAEAVSNPKRADVRALVGILDDEPSAHAGRLAIQGLAAVAEAYPERLRPVVPDLIVATSVEGPIPDHRGTAAEALRNVVTAHPDSVTQYVPAVDDSLREEVAATGAVTVGVTIDERTVDALCAVLSAADTEPARRILHELCVHEQPAVSDAAERALADTSDAGDPSDTTRP